LITTPEQREAILRLRHTQDFQLFIELLADYGQSATERLINTEHLDEVDVLRGQARAIGHIMAAINKVTRET